MSLTQPRQAARAGTTLIELVVAITIMILVMGAVLPLLGSLRHSWDTAQNSADALQNGRVMVDHINLNLGQAMKVTDVSPASQTLGYIEFEDINGNTQRYGVGRDGYVEYGPVGAQVKLAGPVSQLIFTCYDGNDFSTPTSTATDIRFVEIQATVVNAGIMGQDKSISSSVYLSVNGNPNAGATTTMAAHFEYDTISGKEPDLAAIDSTHYLCAYEGDGSDGWATVLTVNPANWALSRHTPYEFDTVRGKEPALAQIDSSRYLCAYSGNNDDGWATVLNVDSASWTITQSAPFEFDTVQGKRPALAQIDDSHYLCTYSGDGDDGWAVVLAIGTSSSGGPMAHWTLDETSGTSAADASGNGHVGTLTNMSGNEWTAGTLEGALAFDGSNDYVAVAHADDFLIDNGTVALWFNARDVNRRGELFSKDASGYGTGGHLTIWVQSSRVGVRLQRAVGRRWGRSYYLWSGRTLQDDTWYHMALRWGAEGLKLYLNGSEVDTDAYTGGLGTTSGGVGNYEPLALGACTWGSRTRTIRPLRYYFGGMLDDVRVYDYALEPNEIASLAGTLSFQGFSEAKAGSDTTSLAVSTPGGTGEGDLLVAAVATDGDTSASLAPPGGQGWNQISLNDNSNEVTLGAWWKLAGASEPGAHQFTWSAPQQAYAWIMRFIGHDPTHPIDVYALSGSTSSSPSSPAVTTTVDDALILRLGAFDDDDIQLDVPGLSGHTAITMDGTGGAGAGQVVFEEFTEAKRTSNGTSVTLNTPAGTSPGDLLIAALVTDYETDRSLTPPPGQGWTEIYLNDYYRYMTLGVWWKLADASEPSTHAFTWSSSQEAYAWMMRFTGHHPSSPIHQSRANRGSSRSPDCDPVTTTVANCMILRIGGFDDDDIRRDVTGVNEGHTDITMDESSSGGGTCSGGAAYEQQATPGQSSDPDFNLTRYEQFITLTLALAPAPSSGGETVSGGAGYVTQADAGGSGASNFALTASEQSQMLTLAIAPAAQTESTVTTITKGTAYEYDTVRGMEPALAPIDSSHYLCAYRGEGDDGWAVVLTVDTVNWTVSRGTRFEFNTIQGKRPALARIDSTHFLCTYAGNGDGGWSTVLTVDTNTWTISQETPFVYNTVQGMEPALAQMDATNYLCAYRGEEDDGWCVVLNVEPTNWTLSSGIPFEYNPVRGKQPALIQIDADHYLCTYSGNGDDGWAAVLMPSTAVVTP